MIVSLNEIESLALKAARGAGMSWGLAEEAAAAAAWLAQQALPWAETLASVLREAHMASPPRIEGHAIVPSLGRGPICPIRAGALLSDLGPQAGVMEVQHVLAPLWLAPFVARWAGPDRGVRLAWREVSLLVAATGVAGADKAQQAALAAAAAAADRVSITLEPIADAKTLPPRRERSGYLVPDDAWRALQALEHRTYVPASTQSRLAGAGAGLLDND